MNTYYVYIMANYTKSTLYIGVTNDLERRIYEHKKGLIDGFTKKYNLKDLVYFAETNSVQEAITKEKKLKKWNRAWKDRLITEANPQWEDLSKQF